MRAGRLSSARSEACSGSAATTCESASWTRPGARLRQHRGDPRVRVLHVVDRVVGALAHGEVQVEVDGRVVGALQQVEARRVDADLLDQLVECHVLALALGHRGAPLDPDQVDELLDHDLERLSRGRRPSAAQAAFSRAM